MSEMTAALRNNKPDQMQAFVNQIEKMTRDPGMHLSEIHQGELYALVKKYLCEIKWSGGIEDVMASCITATWLNTLADARSLQPQPE